MRLQGEARDSGGLVPFSNRDNAARKGFAALSAVLGFVFAASVMAAAEAQTANSDRFQDQRDGGAGLRGTAAAGQQVPDDAGAAMGTAAPGDSGEVINYGRPKPKKPKLFTPKSPLFRTDPRVSRPLPPVVPYQTAPGTRIRKGASTAPNIATPADAVPPGPTMAAIPFNRPPPKPRPDPTPFTPLGIDAGTLRLFPFVELGGGYDSNPNRQTSNVKGSSYGRADAGLDVNSQWANHSLTATLRGGYSDYPDLHVADRPDLQTKIDGRIDVLRDTQIDLEGRFTLDTLQPGSQQLATSGSTFSVGRPLIETYGASAGVTQRFGRLSVRLRGTYDRFEYQDAPQSNGSVQLLSENDYNDIGINTRVSYELTPGLIPYVDVTGDQRLYDSTLDSSGYERSSNGISAKAGSTFEITRIVTGDLAAGYVDRHYQDSRLKNAQGPTLDGAITWTPSALTTVTLGTGTDFVETTLPGSSAAISRRANLQITHNLFRNFTLTGIGIYQVNNYVGQPVTEHVYSGSLLAEYSLTRDIVLRGSYRHERFITTQANSNYSADVFLLGVRLQR
jgi:hypothetical protein